MLRSATADDEPFLWQMLGHSAAPEGPPLSEAQLRDVPELDRYLAGWGRAGDVGVVAVDDASGARLAAAWYRTFARDEPGYAFLDETIPEVAIACTPAGRGRGLGHDLVDALLVTAHDQCLGQLCLSVRTTNVVAVRVYEDCGFAGVRTADDGLHLTMAAPTHPRVPDEERVVVRAVDPGELDHATLPDSAWGTLVARLGELLDVAELPALLATVGGEPAGLLTWRLGVDGAEIEVVGIEAWVRERGVGAALLRALRQRARLLGVRRLWLVTNNDNTDAIRFYQRRGWDLVAVHRGAADRSRTVKPSLPLVGSHGIAVHHEVELEHLLDP